MGVVVRRALWQLALAMVFKALITVLMYFHCSDYQRNLTDSRSYMSSTYVGEGVRRALWQLALAMVFKALITVFTFGMKVSAPNIFSLHLFIIRLH